MRRCLQAVGRTLLFAATLGTAAAAQAQTADNVLLVINEDSPASVQIGEYYAKKRGLAPDHILRQKLATTEQIPRTEYTRTIEYPTAAWLSKYSLQDRILYIVLTKGVPLRVAGTEGRDGTVASVDSELTLLYRRLLGQSAALVGRVPNPYYLAERPAAEAKPFTRLSHDIYLVTRLDGFTVDDVIKLIDRGTSPERVGKFVLDEKATLIDRGGDQWLQQAADRLEQAGAGDRVLHESTRAVVATAEPVMGYFSWGSNDPAAQLRRFGLTFTDGAIGGMFVSTDGRTFVEPPADWKPSPPTGGRPFRGSFQSLAGDLIRDGITGVSGHVAEPYLDATIRPQILFPAYLSGLNLAESFYLAMPFLSWQTVVVGDPLCTPFPRTALTPEQIQKGIDPATELPAVFSERKLAITSRGGFNTEALKLLLKADGQVARDEKATVEALLIKSADLEPRLTAVHLRLADAFEARADYDRAIDRYRRVIAIEPANAIALNNLAYALAVRKNNPKEALPIAEKAYRITPTGFVADTYGWIQHLLGDDRAALPLLERALIDGRDIADIRLHAAIVYAALKSTTRAKAELAAALKLDPKLAERPEVKALQSTLK